MSTHIASRSHATDATSWQPASPSQPLKAKDQSFTADHVIHAFETGAQRGFEHKIQKIGSALSETLDRNQLKAADFTADVLDYLKNQDLKTVEAYLKISSWDELNVLVIVEEASFLKEEFDNIYDVVCSIEEECEKNNLSLSFTFTPNSKEINAKRLALEGYTLKHKRYKDKSTHKAKISQAEVKKKQ